MALLHRLLVGIERAAYLAQGALQSGRYVGQTIAREALGERGARAPFRYKDKGSMATIGRAGWASALVSASSSEATQGPAQAIFAYLPMP